MEVIKQLGYGFLGVGILLLLGQVLYGVLTAVFTFDGPVIIGLGMMCTILGLAALHVYGVLGGNPAIAK